MNLIVGAIILISVHIDHPSKKGREMQIQATRIDDTNFKKYGRVMRKPERKADVENNQLAYWDNSFSLADFAEKGVFGFLEVKRIPVELTMLDLLTDSLRIYLSTDGRPSIQFVALNKKGVFEPEMNTLKAFILENGDGVVIDTGVWHWTPFALTEKAAFAMGLKNDIMSFSGGKYTVDESKVKYFPLKEAVHVVF